MNKFDYLNQHHPDFIIKLLFLFYPFDIDSLKKIPRIPQFFYHLSSNEQVKWSDEILEEFEDQWRWYDLLTNKAILWDKIRVEKYNQHINPKRLIPNPDTINYQEKLFYNPNYVVDEEMLETSKIYFTEDNYHLSDHLKEKYKQFIWKKKIPVDNGRYWWAPDLLFSEASKFTNNIRIKRKEEIEIYHRIILPYFKGNDLIQFLNKQYAHPKIFKFKRGNHNLYNQTSYTVNANIDTFDPVNLKLGEPVEVVINPSQTERESTVFPFSSINITRLHEEGFINEYSVLLVSESVKNDLEKLKLPNHGYTPVNLPHPRIKFDEPYYILIFDRRKRLHNFDFENAKWFVKHPRIEYIEKHFEIFKTLNEEAQEIKSLDDYSNFKKRILLNLHSEFGVHLTGIKLDYTKYLLKDPRAEYDLFVLQGSLVTANPMIKDYFTKKYGNLLSIDSVPQYHTDHEYVFDENEYGHLLDQPRKVPLLSVQLTQDELFYKEKIRRFENREVPPHGIKSGDEFEEIETKLNVIFPDFFKSFYRRIMKGGNKMHGGYWFHSIDRFWICNEYAHIHLDSYHSIEVGMNGAGDSLHCFLEKESDYEIEEGFISIFHETGELNPW